MTSPPSASIWWCGSWSPGQSSSRLDAGSRDLHADYRRPLVKAQNGSGTCSRGTCAIAAQRCRFQPAATPYLLTATHRSHGRDIVKAPSWLIACALVLFSSMLMRASTATSHRAADQRADASRSAGTAVRRRALRRGRARLLRVLRPAPGRVWAATGARAPTATWRRTTSSCRRPMSRRGSSACSARRERHPDADDPLFRPIDADDFRTNGDNASDFSNLRQNGLVRITFPLPPNIRLIDPATNAPVGRDVRGRLAQPCRRSTTWRSPGPTTSIRGRAARTQFGGYQLDGRVGDAAGAGARRAHQSRAGAARAAAAAARRSGVVSARAVHEPSRARAGSTRSERATRRCPIPIRRSTSSSSRARSCSSARARSATAARASRTAQAPVVRFHDISTQCPRPVDTVDARALRVRAVPAATRAQRPDLRDHAGQRHARSAGPAPIPVARC